MCDVGMASSAASDARLVGRTGPELRRPTNLAESCCLAGAFKVGTANGSGSLGQAFSTPLESSPNTPQLSTSGQPSTSWKAPFTDVHRARRAWVNSTIDVRYSCFHMDFVAYDSQSVSSPSRLPRKASRRVSLLHGKRRVTRPVRI